MDEAVKERLENQAFLAKFVRTPGAGLGVAEWIEFVASSVGGFIGDFVHGAEYEAWRVVTAKTDVHFTVAEAGSDIPDRVIGALNERLSEINDAEASSALGDIIITLRRQFLAGGVVESSINGEGISIDFCRGRHLITKGRNLMALHVHGKSLLGIAYDPASKVVSVNHDGNCEMIDGSWASFSALGVAEGNEGKVVPISVPPREATELTPLAARIARSSAGSLQGPSPTGLVISKGEDGRVMIALKGDIPDGKAVVRFLPSAVQIMVNGEVGAQSGFDDVAEILGWLDDNVVEVLDITEGGPRIRRASVEIRTSA